MELLKVFILKNSLIAIITMPPFTFSNSYAVIHRSVFYFYCVACKVL
nr:MAG TPA: hypothetical protein [Caudoviricetes sp.]